MIGLVENPIRAFQGEMARDIVSSEGEAEIQLFKEVVASTALGAAAVGAITSEELFALIDRVGRDTIAAPAIPVLKKVADNEATYKTARQEKLLEQAQNGFITASALEHEFDAINSLYLEAKVCEDVVWLNQEGYEQRPTPTPFDPSFEASFYVNDKLVEEYSGAKNEFVQALGATHEVWQYELVDDRLLSDRVHFTIGTINDAGEFVAQATLLNSDHPAISGITQ